VWPEGLGKLKKKLIYVIGCRTRDLPACSIVFLVLLTTFEGSSAISDGFLPTGTPRDAVMPIRLNLTNDLLRWSQPKVAKFAILYPT
jgi:hypothetical protein